jgi:hypothetical protein
MLKRLMVVAAVAVSATDASAQPPAGDDRPRFEAGVSAGRLFPPVYSDSQTRGMTEPLVEVRATVPVSTRFAVEGAVSLGHSDRYLATTEGLYQILVKQRLRSLERGRLRPFLLYGVAGYYARGDVAAAKIPQPDGTVFDRPAGSFGSVDEPYFAALGGGVDHRTTRHLGVRADAQWITFLGLPAGFRTMVGLSVR